MRKTIADTLEAPLDLVFVKQRRRQSGKSQHEKQSVRKQTFVVNEGGLRFEVNLSDYVDTGLFLDHRQTRAMVREQAAGKDVLNLFCYTSSFSVSAALSGATTTSVDLSGKAIERSRSNFEANGLDPHLHRFFKEDAMKFLSRSVRRSDKYDFIVLSGSNKA